MFFYLAIMLHTHCPPPCVTNAHAAAQDSSCDARATASDLEQAQAQGVQRPGLLRESPTIPPPVLTPFSYPRYPLIISSHASRRWAGLHHDSRHLGVKDPFLHPVCRDGCSDRHRDSNRRAHVQERFSLVSPTGHCCTCYSPFCPLMRTACKLKDLSCLIGRASHSQLMPIITRNSLEGIQEERCLRQTGYVRVQVRVRVEIFA
ncbi:hypothetical protein FIBSPDRAFT_113451 [Athelia psychrophila]|uniref:Uncharacterized protein n=1 Tax=Athelia psychrophila TaxID=1759441 RepID=A0A166D3K0_9AGAM|nr:hypothetical protein FIBSPDRAFT_113451 [Fibularhizoctonia sp. CBS 109695]